MITISRPSRLLLRQLDRRLTRPINATEFQVPGRGWIDAIRRAIGLPVVVLARRSGKTPSAIQQIQQREMEGTVTMNTLRETAHAMGMKLVYAFVPEDGGTIENFLEQKAKEVATKIVMRSNQTMLLEDQQVAHESLEESIEELTHELINHPRRLWR